MAVALVSKDHCARSAAKHSSGQKLPDIADIVLGNGTPGGDALVNIDGMDEPVGPGSTVGGANRRGEIPPARFPCCRH